MAVGGRVQIQYREKQPRKKDQNEVCYSEQKLPVKVDILEESWAGNEHLTSAGTFLFSLIHGWKARRLTAEGGRIVNVRAASSVTGYCERGEVFQPRLGTF